MNDLLGWIENEASRGLTEGDSISALTAIKWKIKDSALSTPPAAVESNASAEARMRVKTADGFEVETLKSGRITKIISGPPAGGGEAKKSEGVQSAYGEYTPITVGGSTSDPTADVTVEDIAEIISTAPIVTPSETTGAEQIARALLNAFTVRRR